MVSHFHSFTLFQKPGGHRGCHPRPNGPRRSAALGMTCVCPTALQRAPALWRSQHPRHGAASTRAASSTRAMPHPAPVPCRSQHPRHGAARGSVHLGHESPAPRCSIAIQCIEARLRFAIQCNMLASFWRLCAAGESWVANEGGCLRTRLSCAV